MTENARCFDAANLLATLRGATTALRDAATTPDTPPSILVGARLRYQEAVRCCQMAGIAVPAEEEEAAP